MSRVEYELQKKYPNRIVKNLSVDNKSLYSYVFSEMKKSKFSTVGDYLNDLGYTYVRKAKLEEDKILDELNLEYPQKIIENISVDNNRLYLALRDLAEESGTSVKEYLSNYGYLYRRTNSSILTQFIVLTLNEKFNVSGAEISRLFGVSRTLVSDFLKKHSGESIVSEKHDLNEEEQELIEIMIEEHEFHFESDEEEIYIFTNRNGEIAIFVKNSEEIKFFSENSIPLLIREKMEGGGIGKYSEFDFEILDNCQYKSVLKEKYLLVNNENTALFTKNAKYRDMSREEYSAFLGFNGYVNNRNVSDENLIDIFEDCIIESKVYIPVESLYYGRLNNFANRHGYKLSELVEFYGYEFAGRDFEEEFEKLKEGYIYQLKEYRLSGGLNEVYIPSNTDLYRNLYLSARNRGMSLDDLIVTLGYKRIHRNGESNKIIKSTVYYKNKSKELKEKISNQIKKHGKKSQIYEIRVRNRKFVEELKEMYDYECQICNNYEIPPIIMDENKKYVEVHHINALKNQDINEEEDLDELWNMIVVCPHHHKVLHYMNGEGFEKIVMVDGILNFINNAGDVLFINRNYHLNELK